jgi:O-methyltransferase
MISLSRAVREAPFHAFWGLRLQHVVKFAPRAVRRVVYRPILYRQRKYCGLVPRAALTSAYRTALEYLLRHTPPDRIGDYFEFGVYDGSSMSCLYRAASDLGLDHVRMFGFDSFAGLPPSATSDDEGHWKPGAFRCDYELTRENLDAYGVDMDRVTLVRGYFEDTLTPELKQRHRLERASIVMVDCDLYSSTKTALDFCRPLLSDLTVLVFDDWYPLAHRDLGEKRALDEFLAADAALSVRDELPSYADNARIFVVARTQTSREIARGTHESVRG